MKNKPAHILLVEDDEVDVANIKRAFSTKGLPYTLHVASTGSVALSMLKGNILPLINPLPKIILLDLHLPDMGGLDFLRLLRSDPLLKACNVIVMTTSSTEKDILEAYDLNVAGYIIKPIQHHSLLSIVDTLDSYWNLIELPH
ncbi:response regulator [Rufibacter roseus]|uniref:Response regulator n=1 Tax=Rufibacter roseus TaxID=1567108 RepID=A0ABW2DNA1_9BACT|nr:response regulator [Rufibacter roseus]